MKDAISPIGIKCQALRGGESDGDEVQEGEGEGGKRSHVCLPLHRPGTSASIPCHLHFPPPCLLIIDMTPMHFPT